LGFEGEIINAKWPKPATEALRAEQITLAVQVNGKLRGQITVVADANEEAIIAAAAECNTVVPYLQGKMVKKKIVVPGKLVNIVI